jgi:hypothetical protein
MKIEQIQWTQPQGWNQNPVLGNDADLVIAYGGVEIIPDSKYYNDLRGFFPKAQIVLASTAGEIMGDRVYDETVIATAVHFEKTKIKAISVDAAEIGDSYGCGKAIMSQLAGEDLCHILIVSEGTTTNGDALLRGVNENRPEHVLVTGGLAADAGQFTQTYVGLNEPARASQIVAIGFYGKNLKVGHGSQGGLDPFGPVRTVTRSSGTTLFELDGVNALELYKKYLGDRAQELPGAALLFPLCLLKEDGNLVRTILSIDEAQGSMTFAGEVPEGSKAQFMLANLDRVVDGATDAALQNIETLDHESPELVMMISCVGRKIILGPRIDEESEMVNEVFGQGPVYFGFYSNGEISPMKDTVKCSLHNQTMTITTYRES